MVEASEDERVVVDPELLARARSLMYRLLYILFSEESPSVKLDSVNLLGFVGGECSKSLEYLARIGDVKARDHRHDLDPVTRSLIPVALRTWYERTGYTIEGEPDSLSVMLAYLSKLAEDEARALRENDVEKAYELKRNQLRFLNTHVKPLIQALIRTYNEPEKTALECLRNLLDNDIELLKEILTTKQTPNE